MRSAAALRADLDNTLILSRGGQHRLAFDDINADGFLDIDINAAFDGGNHGQRMPMVRRADENDVEVLLRQHLAVIVIEARLLFGHLPRGDQIGRGGKHVAIDIAKRNHFHRGDLDQAQQVALAVPSAANEADALF
jgi:hypothetical protein